MKPISHSTTIFQVPDMKFRFVFAVFLLKILSSQSSLLFIYDADDEDVSKIVEQVYQKSQRSNNNFSLIRMLVENPSQEDFMVSLCKIYSESIDTDDPLQMILEMLKFDDISRAIKKFAAALAIPTVSASEQEDVDSKSKYVTRIIPPNETMLHLIRKVIIMEGYQTAAVLVDDEFEVEHIMKKLLQNLPVRHVIQRINQTVALQQLISLQRSQIFNIFVVGGIDTVENILRCAYDVNMLSRLFSWHFITYDYKHFKVPNKQAYITFSSVINSTNAGKNEDLLLLEFYNRVSQGVFNVVSKLRSAYVRDNSDYIKCEEYDGTNTPKRDPINIYQEMVKVFDKDAIDQYQDLDIFYKVPMDIKVLHLAQGRVHSAKTVGVWNGSPKNNLTVFNISARHSYRPKVIYNVITLVTPPLVYEDPSAPKGFSGLCIDLLNELADHLEFDYNIEKSVDGTSGSYLPNNTWTGMVRELHEGRAHLAIGDLSVTMEKMKVLDFTVPYHRMMGHTILMLLPEKKTNLVKFIEVFDKNLWLTIILLYLLSSIFLWILYRFSPYGLTFLEKYNKKYKLKRFTLTECFCFNLMSFTRMGGGEAPPNVACRVSTGVYWIFAFLMTAAFGANLSAFLTMTRLQTELTSLEDLAESSMIFSLINGSNTMAFFQKMNGVQKRINIKWTEMNLSTNLTIIENSKLAVWEYPISSTIRSMFKKMSMIGFVSSLEEGLQKIRNSTSLDRGFALIIDAIEAKYLVMTSCDLQMVSEFNRKALAMAVPKNSALKEKLDVRILELYNTGFLTQLEEKWWDNNKDIVDCSKFIHGDGIRMDNTGGVFIFFGVATAFLVIILIVTRVWKIFCGKTK